MKIGIYDINRNSCLTYSQRLDVYKSVGFNEVGVYIDDSYMNNDENYVDIINYAKKIGLEVKQAHVDYKISNLICDESMDTYFDYLDAKISEAIKLKIKYVIAHASSGNNPPLISNKQINKLKEMMKKYSNSDVYLCFENVRDNTNLDRILSYNIDNVRMCYDLGHAHCYSNEMDLFEKYKDKIVCSHLHNNFGKDSHYVLSEGEIEYKSILNELNKINCNNYLECFPKEKALNEKEFNAFIDKCFNSI